MPKARFAHRGVPKPKSVKSRKVLNEKRQRSRFGKKQKKGLAGNAVEYISRTRAIKQLQISIRDFRRLCILKGIYPRDPPSKRHMNARQSYYHHKDVSFLAHEPLLRKFRETKSFLKKLSRAVGRRELGDARAIYERRPVYSLDHIVKERYPRFADALGDLDDALSAVHLFAGFPAEEPVKTDHTALAQRLAREWQYYVARTRSLRKVFLSVKGAYFQAEVRGVTVTWLVPWRFSQALPSDVDYRVMLTFLELHSVLLEFSLFKLFGDIGLAYPPAIRVDLDAAGAHLAALEVATKAAAAKAEAERREADAAAVAAAAAGGLPRAGAGAGARAGVGAGASAQQPTAEAEARLIALKRKLKQIVRAAGTTGDEGAAGSEVAAAAASLAAAQEEERARARSAAAATSVSLFDFVDADADDDEDDSAAAGAGALSASASASSDAQMRDMAEFADSAEAKAAIEQARKQKQFERLFKGLVFFLNREVPRELFEFIVCSLRGRVGWDGPGSPYLAADPRITHHVIDRPVVASPAVGAAASTAAAFARVEGREYVQPQWIVDSLNARVLLPVAKYAPGAVLPPHLSPFVDDAKEGYVPAYRNELERLRAAAAVTGRLADVLASKPEAAGLALAAPGAGKEEGDGDEEGGEDEEEEEDEEEDDDDGEESLDEDESDEDEDADDLMRRAEAEAAGAPQAKRAKAGAGAGAGGAGGSGAAGASSKSFQLSALETERRAMAATLLSSTQRRAYAAAEAKRAAAAARVAALDTKRRAAFAKGDAGTGAAAAAAAAAAASAAAAAAGGKQKKRPRA